MERWQQGLDNYITGGQYHSWMEELTCKKCNHKWEAKMFTEYGMTYFYNDEDSVCPECGEEIHDEKCGCSCHDREDGDEDN